MRLKAALLAALLLVSPAAGQPAPDRTLTGTMTGSDHQTYREVPFLVPAGTTRITVEFAYTGKAQRAVIDLGVRDTERFRGWSGGNKARFTISEADATPSYLPGPLPAGEWKLVLGVPNLRTAASADYTAKIWFEHGGRGEPEPALKVGPAWYRGDLHLHTAHSDGSCASRTGKRVPCPVFKTLEAAAARGLDFIAVTDHNATSQNDALRELAPYFDDLLLIPGRELTTFDGHANILGPTGWIDFQLRSPRAPNLTTILDQVEAAGGIFSINHPGQPSGEPCMGCGWKVADTDYRRIQAVEAVNGGSLSAGKGAEGVFSGVPFWEARLNEGLRITAVGGSDNHDPTSDPAKPQSVGVPTTVVHAPELSQAAILSGIRAGHVFVDLDGTRDRLLEMTAEAGGRTAEMGDVLSLRPRTPAKLAVHVRGAAGGTLRLVTPQGPLPADQKPLAADETRRVILANSPRWVRPEVRGPDGRLWLLGNPIYLMLQRTSATRP